MPPLGVNGPLNSLTSISDYANMIRYPSRFGSRHYCRTSISEAGARAVLYAAAGRRYQLRSIMTRLTIIALCFLALASVGSVRADDPPAIAYMKARHELRIAPMTADTLASVMATPAEYAGRSIELSGTVTGQVASAAQRTILLSVGSQVVSASLPSTLNQAMWIDVGQSIRALFSIESSPDTPNNLRLIAAAPEADVVAVEANEAKVDAGLASTSRYMSYSREQQSLSAEAIQPNYYDDDGGHPSIYLPDRARRIFGPYHHAVHHFNTRLNADEVDLITNSILYCADREDIDPRLLVAMIIAESDFQIFCTSNKGAMGLGQIMPDEARRYGIRDAYDVEDNIFAAASILRGHLDKYGGAPQQGGVIPEDQLKLIMAAYNAGPGAVRKYHGVPPYRETQHYVQKVAILYKEMCAGSN